MERSGHNGVQYLSMVDDGPQVQNIVSKFKINFHSFLHHLLSQGNIFVLTQNRQGTFEDEEKDIVEVPTEEAYRMGMKSMLRWAKKNMDPKKTRVFFTSMSPSHGK